MSRLIAALLLFGASHAAGAFDFVSVAEPAILYDANSLKAKKLFVATRYLPLEQVVVLDNWVKVRDNSGKLFWVEKRLLSSKRYVMVITPFTIVRRSPDEDAEVVFKATQQLGLEWLGNTGSGWVKVRHAGRRDRLRQIQRRVGRLMKIAVLGSGAWGTALAVSFAPRHRVTLWARDAEQIAAMRSARRNQRYLPDVMLPAELGTFLRSA